MASDTSFGVVRQFEDFLLTVVADAPEIDILAVTDTGSTEIRANAADGRIEVSTGTSDDDDQAAVGFNLNWTAGAAPLKMEARIILSALTDNKYFVGFGDSLPSTDESMFDATTDAVTIGTQSDGIGILFDNDATTNNLWCVAAATDVVTVSQSLSSKYNPVAEVPITLGCSLSTDRKSAAFYVNGEEVYRIDSATVLVAAVDLCPQVVNYEQGTALDIDVDYLFASKGRASA
uniref:Uncharacterized protein n=1 Tax=viral metagenome TaxID=1070528 RepID=A0A6M3KCV3_9ZZZZ